MGGPAGRVHGEILDYIRETGEWVKGVAAPTGPLGEFLENFPRHIEIVVEEVTELYRHTRIVVEEVVDGVARRVELSIEEFLRLTRWTGRTVDVAWLRRAAPWPKRTGSVGEVLAFPCRAGNSGNRMPAVPTWRPPSGGCGPERTQLSEAAFSSGSGPARQRSRPRWR